VVSKLDLLEEALYGLSLCGAKHVQDEFKKIRKIKNKIKMNR
jgi:hypothetical protein